MNKFTLFGRYPFQTILLNLLIITAFVTFAVGVFSPMMTLRKFYFWANTISLYSAIEQLYEQKEWLLFYIITLFSMFFPILKMVTLLLCVNIQFTQDSLLATFLHWTEALGKWSMLDVFIVALLLVSVKLGALAEVTVHYGLYTFAVSVILTIILSIWVNHLCKQCC